MGWVLAEDRALLLAQARTPAPPGRARRAEHRRVRARRGPAELHADHAGRRMIDPAQRAAALNGRAPRQGAAARHRRLHRGPQRAAEGRRRHAEPFTRVDIYAINALAGQIFGQGGGDEARRSKFSTACCARLGKTQGPAGVRRPVASSTIPTRRPRSPSASPTAPIGPGDRQRDRSTPARSSRSPTAAPPRAARASRAGRATSRSSARKRSATGHPLFVAGPQIGYYYPGLTLEVDIHGPGDQGARRDDRPAARATS